MVDHRWHLLVGADHACIGPFCQPLISFRSHREPRSLAWSARRRRSRVIHFFRSPWRRFEGTVVMPTFRLNRLHVTSRIYGGFGCLIVLGLGIAVCGLSQLARVASDADTLDEGFARGVDPRCRGGP
jgi:hypothetical protein